MKFLVLMPFDRQFDDVYVAIRNAVDTAFPEGRAACVRLDDLKRAGRIGDDLISELQTATVCIGDLTGNRPNVLWEVGYATALGKPLIAITQDSGDLPFDIRDVRTIRYERPFLDDSLHKSLAEALVETLRLPAPHAIGRRQHDVARLRTVAITGSTRVDPYKFRRRVHTVLAPFLAQPIEWLTGSFGQADELSIQYLIEHGRIPTVVASHESDVSSRVRTLLARHHLPLVNAEKEQLPTGLKPPSARDLLFLVRADFLVALWSGGSSGTREQLQWYEENQRDHAIAFI